MTRRPPNASRLERPPLGPWRCRGFTGGEVESSSTFGLGQSEPPGQGLRTRNVEPPGSHESVLAFLNHRLYEQSEPVFVREHDRRPVLGCDVPAQVTGYAAVDLPGDRIGVVRVVHFRHQLDRQRCADCTSR